MNTIPQTELQTVTEELGLFDRNQYEQSLVGLSYIELVNECLKQYDLSGLSLDKYRAEWQKKEDARKKNAELYGEISRLNHDLDYAERAIQSVVVAIGVMKVNFELAKDYTHSMKRTVVQVTLDLFNSKLGNLETVLYRRDERQGVIKRDSSEIPF